MVMEFEKSKLGIEQEVEPGMIMVLQTQTGEQVPAKVVKGEGEKITLDLNHPLAGKRLTFKIKILGINEPTSEEHHHH
jgi:FKBP-type peptidyl-prolyl cis-trans isomerase SlyD